MLTIYKSAVEGNESVAPFKPNRIRSGIVNDERDVKDEGGDDDDSSLSRFK